MKKMTLKRPKTHAIRVFTSFFIVGSCLIDLSGLKIRKILNIFTLELPLSIGSQSITEIPTTKISNQFQRSLI